MQSAGTILETDHAELRDLLRSAREELANSDLARAYAATDRFWARLAMHIRAEHLHLFPFVRRVAGDEVAAVLDELRRDHDMFMVELGRAIKALRLAFHFGNETETLATAAQLVEKVALRLVAHDRIEESVVYPVIDPDRISGDEMESLRRGVLMELKKIPPRFLDTK
jgi:iron-sulfur cluster repair protein YtfE (RIC family)